MPRKKSEPEPEKAETPATTHETPAADTAAGTPTPISPGDEPQAPQKGEPPLAKFGPYKAGTSWITVAIWPHVIESAIGSYTVYNAKLSRSYKDRDGNWQVSNGSFRRDELPVAVFALQQAYACIMNLECASRT